MKNSINDAVIAKINSLFLNTGTKKANILNKSIIIARNLGISGPIKYTYKIEAMIPIGRENQKYGIPFLRKDGKNIYRIKLINKKINMVKLPI